MKAEPSRPLWWQSLPMSECCLQELIGSVNVGLDKLRGPVDRAIDVRFCGEVQYGFRIELSYELRNPLRITDIGAMKGISLVAVDGTLRG